MNNFPNGKRPDTRELALPETPHEMPIDRGKVDALVDRVRRRGRVDLLAAFLETIDWSQFGAADGTPLSTSELADLQNYYLRKWEDVGPLFLAELLSTEFMTEQRARGDVVFSERLLELGRTEPELWQEIRQFFRRKEMVTALLAAADGRVLPQADATATADGDEEDR